MKAKDEFSGLAGPKHRHDHPGHTGMEAEGDDSSQKIPKHHLAGSREKKCKGELGARCLLLQACTGPKVSLLEMLNPDKVPLPTS